MTDETAQKVTSLSERLLFFFSSANLRQDKWMRTELDKSGSLKLDDLLKFATIKSISEDKSLLAKAARGDDPELGERIKKLIVINEEREEIRRVETFDYKTMGDGSSLSLYVKNVPVEEGRYAVSRDEIKKLFEQYGRVGIVNLRFGRKEGEKRASALGKVVVEFEDEEGIAKALEDLVVDKKEGDGADNENGDDGEAEKGKSEPKTVLELKGSKLTVEKMLPLKTFQKDGKNKRSRDDDDKKDEEEEEEVKVEFEPVTMDWEKGCVIALTGLSTEKCDRESIREAVSDILKVSKDVKTSGLYVDYTRGQSEGKLRLTESKPDEMKELVDKLTDGSVVIAGEKVESAKILEGEEEEEYWKGFIKFLNDKKRQREEEKASKKRRFSGGRGRGRGRGRR